MVELIKNNKSTLDKKDIQNVIKVLKKEFLGMGKEVSTFEAALSKYLTTNAVCVINGTASIQLALQANDISANDEVLVQSLTFLSTYQAISATGAIPISCDVDPNTMTIDIEDASKKLSKKTKALLLVHFAGGVGNLSSYYKFAKKNNLIIIEDAAHAFGTKYNGKLIGSMNTTTSFSFDGIKNLTSGEGGCVTSKNKKIIKRIKALRVLGITNQKKKNNTNIFDVKEQGWRYHMSDVMAAIGVSQLKRFNKIKKRRVNIAIYYDKNFKNNSNFKILNLNYSDVVPFCYPIVFKNKKIKNSIATILSKSNIEVKNLYYPNHLLKKYKINQNLKVTEKLYHNSILLPLHLSLKTNELAKIVFIINNFFK